MHEPIHPPAVDLDDTTRCPVAAVCATCAAADDLAVATVDTPVGVLCATLCSRCADARELPTWPSWSAAIRDVLTHCEHLDIDVDTAAQARASEQAGGAR